MKYFEPPRRVVKRARAVVDECKEAFKVKEVPKRVIKPRRKDGHVYASGDDNEPLLLEKLQRTRTQSQLRRSQSQFTQSQRFNSTSPKSQRRTQKTINSDDSATETEDEDDILLDKAGPSTVKQEGKATTLPLTPKRSQSPEVDLGRAPGRIIGAAYPLTDFKKNIVDGDLVSKAVEDLGWVIKDIVSKPFASRRSEEMLDCMKAFRQVALQVCVLFAIQCNYSNGRWSGLGR